MDLINLFIDDLKGFSKKLVQLYIFSAFATAFIFSTLLILSEDTRITYNSSIEFYFLFPLILCILIAFIVLYFRSKFEDKELRETKLSKYPSLDVSTVEFIPLSISLLFTVLLAIFFRFIADIIQIDIINTILHEITLFLQFLVAELGIVFSLIYQQSMEE